MKKNVQRCLLIAATLLFSSFGAYAQWTSIAPVYGGAIANDGAVSFSIGDHGYIATGSSTGDMYMYDTLANSWSLVGTVPAGMGHAFAMSFVINGKAYVVGGDTAGYAQNTVWEFDPAAMGNPWTQKNNFPGGARDAGFSFAINNFGYIGAGFDGSNLNSDIWKYNPVNDSWTQLPDILPINGLIFPTSFVIGNKGYIVTGGIAPSGVNEVTNMWCLDGSNDSLSAKANFGGVARQAAFSFSNNSFGFVGGGQSNYTTNYSDMWMYDAANDQWSAAPSAPLYGAAWSSTFVIGVTAYAGLGAKFVGAGLSGTDAFYKFRMDLATGMKNADEGSAQWMLYPNPASENLQLIGTIASSAKILIRDVTGRIVKGMENVPGNRTLFIGDLSSGVYTVLIIESNRVISKKFIRN